MNCPAGCVEAASWIAAVAAFGPIVNWILIVLGWVVVSASNNRRERRKEIRDDIGGVCARIRDIEPRAHEYLSTTSDSDDSARLALQLKSEIQRTANGVTRLRSLEGIDVIESMKEYRQAITGGDFEHAGRQRQGMESQRALEISQAANALIDALEEGFRTKYK